MLMRKGGISGSAFAKHAGLTKLSKSAGQFHDVNGGGKYPLPVESFISNDLATTIYVIFDQLMLGTDATNLSAMTIRVNSVVVPLSALGLNGQPSTQLGMVLVTAVLPGDVVTWTYDPALGDLRTDVGGHELAAGEYPVDNQVGVLTHNGEVVTYNGDPVYMGA